MNKYGKTLGTIVATLAMHAAAAQQTPADPVEIIIFPPGHEASTLKPASPDWQVTVSAVYLNKTGKFSSVPVLDYRVELGSCVSGNSREVDLHTGEKAKVTQKVCMGTVDGDTTLVGWLFVNDPLPETLLPEEKREMAYGKQVEFTTNGNRFDATMGMYRVRARAITEEAQP